VVAVFAVAPTILLPETKYVEIVEPAETPP
jgi:hypothetical protein